METKLFTHSSGFNTNPKNDGHFKRFGTEPNQHGIAGAHVHQPTSICELLDGYTSDKLQLDLIDTKSNKSIKEGIQMHDICANYLRWEKPNKG